MIAKKYCESSTELVDPSQPKTYPEENVTCKFEKFEHLNCFLFDKNLLLI